MTSFKYRFWLKQVRKLKKIKFYLCVFSIGSHRTKGDKVLLLNWYSLHYVLTADRCQSSSDLMVFFVFFVFLIMIIFFKSSSPSNNLFWCIHFNHHCCHLLYSDFLPFSHIYISLALSIYNFFHLFKLGLQKAMPLSYK